MTRFQPGQDIQVFSYDREGSALEWRKAKIIPPIPQIGQRRRYRVQFPDGTRAVFDAEQIMAIEHASNQDALDELATFKTAFTEAFGKGEP